MRWISALIAYLFCFQEAYGNAETYLGSREADPEPATICWT